MELMQTVNLAAQALYDSKALNIVALDVRHLTVICDAMIIASGRNANQVKALADAVDEKMAEAEIPLRRQEGINEAHWAVLDYGTVLVHIFHQDDRGYYNLERLWQDGENRIPLAFDESEE